jgi:hypothetical protein
LEAEAEIERLLTLLDATEHDADFEPSLASSEFYYATSQVRWANGNRDDLEDEHDGREPDVDMEPSLCGIHVGSGTDDDLEDDEGDREPLLGAFENILDQDRAWQTPAGPTSYEPEADPLDAGEWEADLEEEPEAEGALEGVVDQDVDYARGGLAAFSDAQRHAEFSRTVTRRAASARRSM